jgi:hypothetical protein
VKEVKVFTYEIGDKKYFQRRLIFGQIRQLLTLMSKIDFQVPKKVTDMEQLIGALIISKIVDGSALEFLAIVLTPEGMHPKDKDIKAVMYDLEWSGLDLGNLTLIPKVVEDFLSCNPTSSLSAEMRAAGERLAEKVKPLIGSKKPSASSPEETSPKETKSSGTMDPQTQSPTSNTEEERPPSENTSSPSVKVSEG